jgi:D-alanine-D-alanine ligase
MSPPGPSQSLDVTLLLDDTSSFSPTDGNESVLLAAESVEAVEAALVRLGHRPRRLSFALGVPSVIDQLATARPDVVFHLGQPDPADPAGEAQVTALLDLLGLPHTSEPTETLMLAGDKARAKALFAYHGIGTPPYAVSARGELPEGLPAAPWIAKPALEDASDGVVYVSAAASRSELARRLRGLHDRFHQPILIESFVGGREFHVGLIGAELLPVVEVDFTHLPADRPRFAGYESKWKYDSVEFKSTRYTCPAELSGPLGARLQDIARRTAQAFGLQRCSRLDIRMDDAEGLHVLDVNPNPDLSPIATMHKMAEVAGFGYDGLVQRLLDLARGA